MLTSTNARRSETRPEYAGNELDLFANAERWKTYWSSQIREYVFGDALEVGAGFGVNIPYLWNQSVTSLTLIEPDSRLYARLQQECERNHPDLSLFPRQETIAAIVSGKRFNSILYIDVLEHIEADKEELESATSILTPGGYLVVLVPAYQSLYSNFDRSIGHYRRYNRRALERLTPTGCELVSLKSLDSVGLLSSLGNAWLLKQSTPTESQLRFWDNYIVRLSRMIDPLFGFKIGKSIVAIWQKAR